MIKRIFIGLSLGALVAIVTAGTIPTDGSKSQPAVTNAPALVQSNVSLPFVIYYDQNSSSNHYAPSGWMGNTKSIKMDPACRVQPHSGATCLRFEYQDSADWGGVAWQDPANDWGDAPGGWNLTGAKQLIFWARGDKGNEIVTFKFGILGPDKKYPDSAYGSLEEVKLTPEWKRYSISLAGKDLTRLKTGFAWNAAGQPTPTVFYLDDIRYE